MFQSAETLPFGTDEASSFGVEMVPASKVRPRRVKGAKTDGVRPVAVAPVVQRGRVARRNRSARRAAQPTDERRVVDCDSREQSMAAYLIARLDVADPALLADYLKATPPVVAKYHGKFIARGGPTVTLEGPQETRRIVILEFPTLDDVQAFYHSPEYAEARELREGIAVAEFLAVDGVQ